MERERAELADHIVEAFEAFSRRSLLLGVDRQLSDIDLTMPQFKALVIVAANNGIPMSQFARAANMTMSTATGVADRLIAHGLVRREQTPDDRRVVLLYTTEDGSRLLDRLTRVSEQMVQDIANRLSLQQLAQIADALDLLYSALLDSMTDVTTSLTQNQARHREAQHRPQ